MATDGLKTPSMVDSEPTWFGTPEESKAEKKKKKKRKSKSQSKTSSTSFSPAAFSLANFTSSTVVGSPPAISDELLSKSQRDIERRKRKKSKKHKSKKQQGGESTIEEHSSRTFLGDSGSTCSFLDDMVEPDKEEEACKRRRDAAEAPSTDLKLMQGEKQTSRSDVTTEATGEGPDENKATKMMSHRFTPTTHRYSHHTPCPTSHPRFLW